MDAAGFGEREEGIQALSDFMQAWVASVVRQYPDQWFWLYSRWLSRPDMHRVLRAGLDFREYVSKRQPGDEIGTQSHGYLSLDFDRALPGKDPIRLQKGKAA